ncbi:MULTISPECIES: MBL fold metallo-hydrolase [Paraburkholderia]|uniref:MBL fold metallo-hydrolase n=1 Tax=Paraburkholderia TaxID=1822464 RepID=UPI002250D6C3|nr:MULTISPECIES: MBL fold metallo-hydrolase [Paraburkholderia]MCX4162796.1 MBL fold metallo-hydrolase [Paraburkholderia megapolitana]MDN7158291.1 MBL fold metallo-hydrolase [Paraburkholderia sp. CHISQ3]MDQ6495338.1 MBL fold metallo-hydrolase [Paraburkholderia megapolitana]
MKVHFLGHASLLIETSEGNILMDPVFGSSHQEGLLDIFPKRTLHKLDELYPVLLIITHRHLDHFDVETLANLPRECRVIIPDDDLLSRALTRLGYRNVERVQDFDELTLGKVQITITRSENRVPEFGAIVRDGSCVLWNVVDTIVSAATSTRIAEQYGPVDLLIAPWQPLLENNFPLNRPLAFPYERVGAMLEQIARIAPRHVVPGACMFSYLPPAEYMNQLVFPLTPVRFTDALLHRCPGLAGRCYSARPADIVTLHEQANGTATVTHECGASPFASLVATADSEPRFSPVTFGVPFVHPSEAAAHSDDASQWREIVHECTAELPRYIASLSADIRDTYARWNVIYQLTVVSPTRTEQWHYHLAEQQPTANPGPSEHANLESTVTASALHGLIEGTRGWDYLLLSGSFRSFVSAYEVDQQGLTYPPPRTIAEPLRSRYAYDTQIERVIAHQLASLGSVVSSDAT